MINRNNFWHFGDSFSLNGNSSDLKTSFGWYLSEKFDRNYLLKGKSGNSNNIIFSDILQNDSNFKENDIVFINWSFFHRGSYVDDNGYIQSTNKFFNENENNITIDKSTTDFLKKHEFILDYTLNYSYDSNIKLFKGMVNPYIDSLYSRGIKVYSLFIRGNETLKYGNNTIKNTEYNINPTGTIEFNPSYLYWLISKGWKNEEEGHYSKGIQEKLANEIYSRIESL